MYKKVDIHPQSPIFSLGVPITSSIIGMQMSVGDILRCIHARAIVDEILPSGKKVRLDLRNYDKDNSSLDVVKNTQPQTDKKPDKQVPPKIEPAAVTHKQKEEGTEQPKTSNEDPRYFKENEKQKNKIEG